MRRVRLAGAMLATVAIAIAGASVVSAGTSAPPLPRVAEAAVSSAPGPMGETVADPRGGPPWVVRVSSTGAAGARCLTVGRTDGRTFGPVNAAGRILETGPSATGSCADADADPLQVALARYADSAGTGPRTVLFGVADAGVERVVVIAPDWIGPVALDGRRTFVVVSERLARDEAWRVIATLSDGTQRIYPL
jgi:hypothetical protein